jgi:DNA-binding NarL/FixJ family response regulator
MEALTMTSKPIRVLVVDGDPSQAGALPPRMGEVQGIEAVGVAHNRRVAGSLVESLQPDVLVVDLMLPGYRSIDLVRQVAASQPQVRILAATPDDPPHDRIMLAAEAGALGFISRQAPPSEYAAAIEQVHRGEPWLPLLQTYEVLQDGAGELAVSSQERRARLTEVLLGLIPLTGLVAAITSYLWRSYWGDIGVRVADLGVDPTTRMIDVLVVFLMIIAIFGPLLFVRPFVKAIGTRVAGKPRLARTVAKVHNLHLAGVPVGRLIINHWVAWVLLTLLVLSIMLILTRLMPLIMVLFVGPALGIILVANVLDMDDELPDILHLPHLDSWRVLGFFGLILIVFLLALGAEVLIMGPDLRPDGLHGILAPKVLGFRAKPVMLYDLDGELEPLGALYLGGNADLYVLYDPCVETVRLVPVGSSRVELIDRVDCRSP